MVHGEVRSLTGIRALAVLGILVSSASGPLTAAGAFEVPVIGTLLRAGTLGFDLMFVLSGLLMIRNHPWLGAAQSVGGAMRFWAIRLARFYPVYLLALIVVVVWNLVGGWGTRLTVLDIVRSALLVQSWGEVPVALAATWSISVIWFAYLTFPLLSLALAALRRNLYALATIWVGCLALVMIVCRDTSVSGWPALVRGIGEFVIGATTYCLVMLLAGRAPARRWARLTRGLGALMAIVLTVGVLTVPDPLVLLPAVAVLLGALLRMRQGVSSALGIAPLVALGTIGYATYMTHGIWYHVIETVGAAWAPSGALQWIVVATMVVGAFAVGALVWIGVERPLRTALTTRLRGRALESDVAAQQAL